MGALSVTGTAKYREPFEPMIGGVTFADYNDLESVSFLVNNEEIYKVNINDIK